MSPSPGTGAPPARAEADGARPPLLALEDVAKVFGREGVALQGFSLEVRQGEFLSLLGPSGCGKSTVLRLIAGLIRPTEGRLRWADAGTQSNLGIVFQEPTLMPWATVEDNVWLPLRMQGRSRRACVAEIGEALEMVGLSGAARAYPRELSGGMKMRVSIARALVTRPRLILMDEPFAALDEITRFRLNDDLLAIRQKLGATVVFVTHSIFESVFLSERVVVMAARPGRVAAEIAVDAPYPRDAAFRTSADYIRHTRAASEALAAAMQERRHGA